MADPFRRRFEMTKKQLARLSTITPQPAPDRAAEAMLLQLGTSADKRANEAMIGHPDYDGKIQLHRGLSPGSYDNYYGRGTHTVWLYNQHGQARICPIQD